MKKIIYIAEDDENIRYLIRSFLEDAGYAVQDFETGDLLYRAFQEEECDLAILDIMMPGTDGLTICERLREISKVPIIVLTARDSELDYVEGITRGGDDYLTKPLRPTVLMMRVKALLRRVDMEHETKNEPQDVTVQYGDLTYYSMKKIICRGDRDLQLTMTELAVLAYFMQNSANAVSREDLLSEIWGMQADVETRVTDETIRRIRKKIRLVGSCVQIQPIWGYGYKLGLEGET